MKGTIVKTMTAEERPSLPHIFSTLFVSFNVHSDATNGFIYLVFSSQLFFLFCSFFVRCKNLGATLL